MSKDITSLRSDTVSIAYHNSRNADSRFGNLFYSQREEEGDGQFNCPVQRHSDKHTAGVYVVPKKSINGESEKYDDFAASKKGGHVETSEVGTLHDLTDFLSEIREKHK